MNQPVAHEDQQPAAADPPLVPRLYILVLKDLPGAQRAVQSAHAATQLVIQHFHRLAPSWGPLGPHIVIYAVSAEQLKNISQAMPPPSASFYEPDLGQQLTASAYWGAPLPLFESLRLL
jgi:hypothetical protein